MHVFVVDCLERELYLTTNRGDLQARCTVCGFTHKISQTRYAFSALSVRVCLSTATSFAKFCVRACLPHPHRNLSRQGKMVLVGIAVFVVCNFATIALESTDTNNKFTILLCVTQQTLVFWTATMVSLQLQEFWRVVILGVYVVKFVALFIITRVDNANKNNTTHASSSGARASHVSHGGTGGVAASSWGRSLMNIRSLPDISLLGFALCIIVLACMLLIDLVILFRHESRRQLNSQTRIVYVNSKGPFKISRPHRA